MPPSSPSSTPVYVHVCACMCVYVRECTIPSLHTSAHTAQSCDDEGRHSARTTLLCDWPEGMHVLCIHPPTHTCMLWWCAQGSQVQHVMNHTGCHVHFPDTPRVAPSPANPTRNQVCMDPSAQSNCVIRFDSACVHCCRLLSVAKSAMWRLRE